MHFGSRSWIQRSVSRREPRCRSGICGFAAPQAPVANPHSLGMWGCIPGVEPRSIMGLTMSMRAVDCGYLEVGMLWGDQANRVG